MHYKDIELLMQILGNMADHGNTVIMIEHRLEMITQADWIIEMGPRGGSQGGKVIYQGLPQDIIKSKDSLTGKYIRERM